MTSLKSAVPGNPAFWPGGPTQNKLKLSALALTAFLVFFAFAPPLAFAAPAGGGIARKGVFEPQAVFNPKPDKLDLGLPMPCGLYMIFRVVGFNVDGKLDDMKFRFGFDGSAQSDDSDESSGPYESYGPAEIDDPKSDGYLHHRRAINLGSALSIDHLPPEWRPIVEASLQGIKGDQIYLMGKYEVTNAQWDAVMGGGECKAFHPDSPRPKTSVSWYDVMEFTERYMVWLLANAPQSLPAYGSQQLAMGVLRLPTEDEWEYAAMGGHLTDKAHLDSKDFFPRPEGRQISDYGLFVTSNRNPAQQTDLIGRYLPNPLGLYDTAGNVAEMTLSTFKMTVGDRLHGSAGGFVRKGGSYSSFAADYYPGKRVETPLFRLTGPVSARDVGFRLALSSANTTGPARMNSLMTELARLLPPPAVLSDKAKLEDASGKPKAEPVSVEGLDPLQKIDALIAAANDPDLRDRYAAVRGDLGDFRISEAWQNEAAVRNNCRALLYVVYTSRNTYSRYLTIVGNFQGVEGEIGNLKKALEHRDISDADKKTLRENIKSYEGLLAGMGKEAAQYIEVLNYQFGYYKQLLESLGRYDALDRQSVNNSMVFIRQDIKGEDLYAEAMRAAYDRVNQDVASARSGRADKITQNNLLGIQ